MRIFQPFFNHFSTILHQSNTNPTQVLRKSYESLTQGLRQSYTNPTQVLRKSSEGLTQVLHKSYANPTPIQHKASESLVHLSSETPALILFFELNEEFDQ